MDTPASTTSSRSGHFKPDVAAPRRAYLDTYAKRRVGVVDDSPQLEQQPVAVAVPNSAPDSEPQGATLVDVLQQQSQTIQAQPVAQQVQTAPAQVAPVTTQPAPVATASPEQRRAHLDTLVASHQARVQSAPLAEETVQQPQLTEATQHLIDDATHHRITANLDALYNKKPLTEHVARTSSSSSNHARTIIASALACGVLSVGIFSFTAHYDSQPVVAEPIGAPIIEVEATAGAVPTGKAKLSDNGAVYANPTDPVKLIISSIGVNARVDGLGTTADGLIAVPKSYGTAGWYNKGATVGQAGPAVFVGHYTGGAGGVFDKLGDVNEGDLVTVQNAKGETFTYRIAAKAEYDKNNVPMTEIFRKSDTSRLEIITCSGKWQSNNYNNRLVVTAELVQ